MTLGGVLFIVFLILKLIGTIDWSWWYICLPLIIETAFYFVIFFGIAVFRAWRRP